MPGGPTFFAELKRRNVLRAAVLYVATVWALSQGISQLSPAIGLPDYATRWFLIAALIGLPLWLAFAWFYEFTPQGFRRDAELPADAPLRHSNARRLDFAIIGVLALAVVLLASGYFIHRSAPANARGGAAIAPSFNPPADTLVVLPFANASGDPEQQYFSDGITEELTNALGQNTALRVIAWDTASHYRDGKRSAAEIGKALNVANVLTGKILRQGNAVRVLVELVNARTGYQVWANHYDDSLANVFAVQDQITTAIAGALKVKFASLGAAPTVNPQAHDLVLRANALLRRAHTAAPIEGARSLYAQAAALDPAYAAPHAGLADAWFGLAEYSTLPLGDALRAAREEAHRALALDPRNVEALTVLAQADVAEGKPQLARREYRRALAIDPSNAGTHLNYGNVLPLRDSQAQTLEAVNLDPDNAAAQNNLAANYLDMGEYAEALAPLRAVLRLDPHSADAALGLAAAYALLHRNTDAVQAFDLARPDTDLAKALVATGRVVYQSRRDPGVRDRARAAVTALSHRRDLDPFSLYDVLQLELALGETETAMTVLPRLCAAIPVGCSDLSVSPAYLPLRGDPRFQRLVRRYDTISKPPAPASSSL